MTAGFAELVCATNYSFLRGASHPADMVARALELGLAGIGIADRNTVAARARWRTMRSATPSSRAPSCWYRRCMACRSPAAQAARAAS